MLYRERQRGGELTVPLPPMVNVLLNVRWTIDKRSAVAWSLLIKSHRVTMTSQQHLPHHPRGVSGLRGLIKSPSSCSQLVLYIVLLGRFSAPLKIKCYFQTIFFSSYSFLCYIRGMNFGDSCVLCASPSPLCVWLADCPCVDCSN